MSFNASLEQIIGQNHTGLLGSHSTWSRIRLGDVCSILNGYPFPSSGFEQAGGMPLLRIRDVGSTSTDARFVGDYDEQFVVHPGELVVGMDGDFKCAPWRGPLALLNQRTCKVTPDERYLSPALLAHVLPGYLRAVNEHTPSITVKHLSSYTLADLPLPLPPRSEQDRLAAQLDVMVTDLNEAVATLERVQRNLKRYRASVLKAAVEGRLVPTEAEIARAEGRDFEPAAELLARTEAPPRPNRWNSRSTDVIPGHAALAVGNPGSTLPAGWAWSALADVARMESGHTPSRSHPEWWGGEFAWITLSDARAHDGGVILDTEERTNAAGLENSAARLLPGGTVCISRTASVGYVVVMGKEMATSQDFVNWTPTEAVTSDWLRIVFTADRETLRRFGKGTVHKTIYFPEWLSIHVAVPPLPEQRRVAEEADRLLTIATAQEGAIKVERARLARLRQSILRWAFEGKLVDQDPNDEPASVLLARIEAERATAVPVAKSRAKKSHAEVTQ